MSNGGRPASAPPADVTVELGEEPLGRARVVPGFNAYSFAIPPVLAARVGLAGEPVRIRLRTMTWNPELQLGTPDDRELGVMVDRVTVK
jgi:hypothetical protein